MELGAFVKEQQELKPITEFQGHIFLFKDGEMKISPSQDTRLKMRSSDPLRMELLQSMAEPAESAMFGICPGVARDKETGAIKAHGICIYTKKEIIVDKSGTHKVPLRK